MPLIFVAAIKGTPLRGVGRVEAVPDSSTPVACTLYVYETQRLLWQGGMFAGRAVPGFPWRHPVPLKGDGTAPCRVGVSPEAPEGRAPGDVQRDLEGQVYLRKTSQKKKL